MSEQEEEPFDEEILFKGCRVALTMDGTEAQMLGMQDETERHALGYMMYPDRQELGQKYEESQLIERSILSGSTDEQVDCHPVSGWNLERHRWCCVNDQYAVAMHRERAICPEELASRCIVVKNYYRQQLDKCTTLKRLTNLTRNLIQLKQNQPQLYGTLVDDLMRTVIFPLREKFTEKVTELSNSERVETIRKQRPVVTYLVDHDGDSPPGFFSLENVHSDGESSEESDVDSLNLGLGLGSLTESCPLLIVRVRDGKPIRNNKLRVPDSTFNAVVLSRHEPLLAINDMLRPGTVEIYRLPNTDTPESTFSLYGAPIFSKLVINRDGSVVGATFRHGCVILSKQKTCMAAQVKGITALGLTDKESHVWVGTQKGVVFQIDWLTGHVLRESIMPDYTPILQIQTYANRVIVQLIQELIVYSSEEGGEYAPGYAIPSASIIAFDGFGTLLPFLSERGNVFVRSILSAHFLRRIDFPFPDNEEETAELALPYIYQGIHFWDRTLIVAYPEGYIRKFSWLSKK